MDKLNNIKVRNGDSTKHTSKHKISMPRLPRGSGKLPKCLTAGIYIAASHHELEEIALKNVKEINQQKRDKELAAAQKKE